MPGLFVLFLSAGLTLFCQESTEIYLRASVSVYRIVRVYVSVYPIVRAYVSVYPIVRASVSVYRIVRAYVSVYHIVRAYVSVYPIVRAYVSVYPIVRAYVSVYPIVRAYVLVYLLDKFLKPLTCLSFRSQNYVWSLYVLIQTITMVATMKTRIAWIPRTKRRMRGK